MSDHAHAAADGAPERMPPEMRASQIADQVGMGPIDQRRQRVFNAALAHIRAAVAIATNRARQDLPALADD